MVSIKSLTFEEPFKVKEIKMPTKKQIQEHIIGEVWKFSNLTKYKDLCNDDKREIITAELTLKHFMGQNEKM